MTEIGELKRLMLIILSMNYVTLIFRSTLLRRREKVGLTGGTDDDDDEMMMIMMR